MTKRSKQIKGFSLIELMVVIAIVAILAAVAAPSYKHYILSAKVGSVIPILNDATNQARQFRDRTGAFAGNFTEIPGLPSSSYASVQVFNGDSFGNTCTSDPGAVGYVELDINSTLDSSLAAMGVINQIYTIDGVDVILCQNFYAFVDGPVPDTGKSLVSGCDNMYADGYPPTIAAAKTSALFAQACPGG